MFLTNTRSLKITGPASIFLLLILSIATIGCSGDGGVKKHAIDGTVSLNGMPPIKASLRFTPNAKSGTTGPQAFAFATNGEFSLDAAQGLVAGVFDVTIDVVDENEKPIGSTTIPITVDPNTDNVFKLEFTSADLKETQSGEDDEGDDEDEDD